MNANQTILHPYMAWTGQDPRDGAALAFAHTAREARRIAYPVIRDWCDVGYIDVRARRLRDHEIYLMAMCARDVPHAIDDLPVCSVCETWGAPPRADGSGCENCGGDNDILEERKEL